MVLCALSSSQTSHGSHTQSSEEESSAAGGHSWKKLSKTGGEILSACFFVAMTIIAVGALVIGATAFLNPAGLALVGGTIGAMITTGLAIAAENSIVVLAVGSVSTFLLCVITVISLLSKRCGV